MRVVTLISALAAIPLVAVSERVNSDQFRPDMSGGLNAPVILASEREHSRSRGDMKMVKIGDLIISRTTARATPPNAPVSSGYLTIRNTGGEADRLIEGSAAFAAKVEIHEMKMEGEVMKMRPVEGGLEIPAGGEIVLKPGGLHIMFMKLSERLTAGETRTVILKFGKAGDIELEFAVEDLKPGHGSTDRSGHKTGN